MGPVTWCVDQNGEKGLKEVNKKIWRCQGDVMIRGPSRATVAHTHKHVENNTTSQAAVTTISKISDLTLNTGNQIHPQFNTIVPY